MRALIAASSVFIAFAAAAQEAPVQGIGFAQAEQGTWLCRHEDPVEALACARELCAEQSPGQDCHATAWCYPANWSGLVSVWLADIRTTRALCGAPNEKALTDALAALCAADDQAERCDLTLIVDPAGNERPVEGVSFPGAAPASPDAGTEVAPATDQQELPEPDAP